MLGHHLKTAHMGPASVLVQVTHAQFHDALPALVSLEPSSVPSDDDHEGAAAEDERAEGHPEPQQ